MLWCMYVRKFVYSNACLSKIQDVCCIVMAVRRGLEPLIYTVTVYRFDQLS